MLDHLPLLAGGPVPLCRHGEEYLRFRCPATPLLSSSNLPSFLRLIPQFLSLQSSTLTYTMSDVSVKLKTPQTGEYEQPTGL